MTWHRFKRGIIKELRNITAAAAAAAAAGARRNNPAAEQHKRAAGSVYSLFIIILIISSIISSRVIVSNFLPHNYTLKLVMSQQLVLLVAQGFHLHRHHHFFQHRWQSVWLTAVKPAHSWSLTPRRLFETTAVDKPRLTKGFPQRDICFFFLIFHTADWEWYKIKPLSENPSKFPLFSEKK